MLGSFKIPVTKSGGVPYFPTFFTILCGVSLILRIYLRALVSATILVGEEQQGVQVSSQYATGLDIEINLHQIIQFCNMKIG